MSRPLRFRLWSRREHAYVNSLLQYGMSSDGHLSCRQDDIVEQFTGLLDKNGQEIYEGDVIVSMLERGGIVGRQVAVIEFAEAGFWARLVTTEPHDFKHYTPLGGMQPNYWGKLSRIIGNIHENPELLK